MPRIQNIHSIDITPERFLNACDPTELHELQLLLSKPVYQNRMQEEEEEDLPLAGPIPRELLESFNKESCHQCGCTDYDCSQCIEKTGEPCYWVAENLCSACAENSPISE